MTASFRKTHAEHQSPLQLDVDTTGDNAEAPVQEVPTEEDWGNLFGDVEALCAYEKFAGRSVDEILPWLSQRLEGASLYYLSMPAIPFQYYLQAWERLLRTQKRPPGDDSEYALSVSTVAFCFATIILERLKSNPHHVMPIMDRLLPVIDDIANNPERYGIDESFDTSVPDYLPPTFYCWEIRERYEQLRAQP